MKRIIVRYELFPHAIDEHLSLVRGVFAELAELRPPGLRYAAFQLQDDVHFVHLTSIETPDGSNPLTSLASFKEFQRNLMARCAVQPVATPVRAVGIFGWTSDAP